MAHSQSIGRPDHYLRLEVTSKIERKFGNNTLVVEKNGSAYDYKRITAGEVAVKSKIASDQPLQIGILPVAPLHVPTKYGSNMMLKFSSPLVVQSGSILQGYFVMPYEIGVVTFDNGRPNIVDAISLGLPKYGLYGNPENGVICRSYQTDLSSSMPEPHLHQESVGTLQVRNTTDRTQKVTKLVFPIEDVDFYFDENRVFSKDVSAVIKEVSKKTLLETLVVDRQWGYKPTGLAQTPTFPYVMEWGF